MNGTLLLEGGAEFGGMMYLPDTRALELAGGSQASVVIIPTAAAPDHNAERAGRNGERWFRNLGAHNVSILPLLDRASAADSGVCHVLRSARLIFLLGGFTHYLGQTLLDSPAADAMRAAHADGAVLAGSSAGAMVLCEVYLNPEDMSLHPGLNLLPGCCVLPHHNTFGMRWAARLLSLIPDKTLIGIDEHTGLLNDDPSGLWRVCGQHSVTLYKGSSHQEYSPDQVLALP